MSDKKIKLVTETIAADGCSFCQKMKPVLKSLDAQGEIKSTVLTVGKDPIPDDLMGFMKTEKKGIPFTIVRCPNGKIAGYIEGYFNEKEMKAMLKNAANKCTI